MNNNLEHGSQGSLTDPYISSLNSANPMPVKMGQSIVQSHHQSDQDMHRQEEEYKKSVTVIFWYQANAPPIRLHQMVPTFPYFQLSKLNTIVAELGLSANTYLDTYNPETGHWDQHPISAVRKIESQQRLLYRLRKSLLEGLKDDECFGIEEELKIQHRSNKSFLAQSASPVPTTKHRGDSSTHRCVCKRSSIDDTDPSSHVSHKIHIPNDYYLNQQPILHRTNGDGQEHLSADTGASAPTTSVPTSGDAHAPPTQSLPTPPSSSSSNVSSDDFSYPGTSIYDNTTTPNPSATNLSSPTNLAIPISPYPPHPPLKRWPNDYTVREISSGFNTMDSLVAQSSNGSTMTHKAAFERVFGSRYVKSTVCRHRGVWKKAHPNLKAQYEAMGHDERAYWGEFVRHVEGRPSSLRVTGNSTLNPAPNANLVQRQGVTEEDEDGGHVDESQVMKNLQNSQVGSTIPNIDAYDSPLASLATATHS